MTMRLFGLLQNPLFRLFGIAAIGGSRAVFRRRAALAFGQALFFQIGHAAVAGLVEGEAFDRDAGLCQPVGERGDVL